MNQLMPALVLFSTFISSASQAEAPTWLKSPTIKHINTNTVVINCEGKGISRQLSYQEAKYSCATLASDQKNNSIKVSQTVIESESEHAKLYSSVESIKQVISINGKIENEGTSETETGYTTYLQIRYDLSEMKVSAVNEDDGKPNKEVPLLVLPKVKSSSGIEQKKLVTDTTRSITVQLSDHCKDYIVRGKQPRSQSCGNKNVIQVMVNSETDQEIIFRPVDNHFLPISVKISGGRIPAKESEVLDVQFQQSK